MTVPEGIMKPDDGLKADQLEELSRFICRMNIVAPKSPGGSQALIGVVG